MIILDSNLKKQILNDELSIKFNLLRKSPRLVIIQLGQDIASSKYIELKKKKASEFGVILTHKIFFENSKCIDIINYLEDISIDDTISGIMIQSPIPDIFLEVKGDFFKNIDSKIRANIKDKSDLLKLFAGYIPSYKDVDGMNFIFRCSEHPKYILPPVVRSILYFIKYKYPKYSDLNDRNITIINDNFILGLPLVKFLSKYNDNIQIINKYTKLDEKNMIISSSDIIISATGVEKLVSILSLKDNCLFVDCGSPRPELSYDEFLDKDKNIILTKVPGGVGPLTVLYIFDNLYELLSLNPLN